MTTIALQKRVIENIVFVEDKTVLEKINQLIDSTSKVYVLSEYQLELLKEADEDLKYGRITTQEEMEIKLEEWKNRK